MPSVGPATAFAERRRRRVPMLGAVVPPGLTWSSEGLIGLDFVVLTAPVTSASVAAQSLPTLVLVSEPHEVAAALQAGALELLARTPVEGTTLLGSAGRRARLVASVDDARAAFAEGSDLVVYEIGAMFDRLVTSLGSARPPSPEPTAREPLVLLSGMLGDQSLWDGLSAGLADVVLPWPARIDLDDSVPELAASVLAQAPPRFALAGHSLGAIVALEIVRRAPGRVTTAVLINASGRGPSEAQQQSWRSWRDRTEAGEFHSIAKELALATLASNRRNDEDIVRANAAMAVSVGADGFLRQLAAQSTRPDSIRDLKETELPVLVVSGELDEVCPPALQRELVEHCPTAEWVTIAGAGHMVPLEAPDALAEHIRRWLVSHNS